MTDASPRPISRTQRAVAVACALTIWLLGLFAASSPLHLSLHDDAAHTGHSCAITLFSHGLEDSLGWAELAVHPSLLPSGEIETPSVVWVTESPGRLPPGRGPPLC